MSGNPPRPSQRRVPGGRMYRTESKPHGARISLDRCVAEPASSLCISRPNENEVTLRVFSVTVGFLFNKP